VGLCAAAPPAEAADRWRVSGAFSGTYDNTTGWPQCVTGATGTASEHVDLDVRLGPGTANYRRGEPQPASRLRGRRAFTVAVTPGSQNPSECPDAYQTCTQTNRLKFTLRFTPRP
jgi:hypothetical protein